MRLRHNADGMAIEKTFCSSEVSEYFDSTKGKIIFQSYNIDYITAACTHTSCFFFLSFFFLLERAVPDVGENARRFYND